VAPVPPLGLLIRDKIESAVIDSPGRNGPVAGMLGAATNGFVGLKERTRYVHQTGCSPWERYGIIRPKLGN